MLNKLRKYLLMLAVAVTVTAVTIPTTSTYVYADEDDDEREREEEEEREREEREREEEEEREREEREREEREEQERREREERERKHRSGDIWIDADDTYIDVDHHTTLKAKVKAKGDYHIDWEISDSSVASLLPKVAFQNGLPVPSSLYASPAMLTISGSSAQFTGKSAWRSVSTKRAVLGLAMSLCSAVSAAITLSPALCGTPCSAGH